MPQVRHCREDALSEREFELLLQGAQECENHYRLQCEFVIFIAGRLGLRIGEIAHMKESWIDFGSKTIYIPVHEPCDIGRDGGICGHCRQNAAQKAETRAANDYEEEHSRLSRGDEAEPGRGGAADAAVPEEEIYESMWTPKTDQAVRGVPYDVDPRCELIIEDFFDRYDEWPHSVIAVNRRVKRAAENACSVIDPNELYPHALRATSATYWAGRGLDTLPLQSLFGWAQSSTAEVYVQDSVENTRRSLNMISSA